VPNGRADGGGLGAGIPPPLKPFALPKRNPRSGNPRSGSALTKSQKAKQVVLVGSWAVFGFGALASLALVCMATQNKTPFLLKVFHGASQARLAKAVAAAPAPRNGADPAARATAKRNQAATATATATAVTTVGAPSLVLAASSPAAAQASAARASRGRLERRLRGAGRNVASAAAAVVRRLSGNTAGLFGTSSVSSSLSAPGLFSSV
jgi:hypothetical protein